MVLHSAMILLISSKAGIISLFIITGGLFFRQKSFRNIALGILAMILLGLISINIPSTRLRIEKVYNEIASPSIIKDKGNNRGRLILWNTIGDYSKLELLTGIGTNTARNRVMELTGEDKNMHNQFLQALVSSGILGLILLICFISLPFVYSRHFFSFFTHFTALFKSMNHIVILNLVYRVSFCADEEMECKGDRERVREDFKGA